MSTTSRVPAVIAYLVAAFQNSATLGQASPPVTIQDGPKVTADPGPLALWVGADDISPSAVMPAAATSTQQWLEGLGRVNRQESLSVHCTAQAWSGSDDVATLRAAVNGIVSAAEAVVRADPSLGGTLPGSHDAGITGSEWRQGPTTRGMAVQVAFTIDATAVLGG